MRAPRGSQNETMVGIIASGEVQAAVPRASLIVSSWHWRLFAVGGEATGGVPLPQHRSMPIGRHGFTSG